MKTYEQTQIEELEDFWVLKYIWNSFEDTFWDNPKYQEERRSSERDFYSDYPDEID